jgi:hypothetical protein
MNCDGAMLRFGRTAMRAMTVFMFGKAVIGKCGKSCCLANILGKGSIENYEGKVNWCMIS